MKVPFYLFILTSLFMINCGEEKQTGPMSFDTLLEGQWLGSSKGVMKQPFPMVYDFSKKYLTTTDHNQCISYYPFSIVDTIFELKIDKSNRYLNLDNFYNKKKKVILTLDTLAVNFINEDELSLVNLNSNKMEFLFLKIKKEKNSKDFRKEAIAVHQQLQGKVWSSDFIETKLSGEPIENNLTIKTYCKFEAESYYLKRNYYLKDKFLFVEYEQYCYKISNIENTLLFNHKNFHADCEHPLPTYQITNIGEEVITLKNHRNGGQDEFSLTLQKSNDFFASKTITSFFVPCSNHGYVHDFMNGADFRKGKKGMKQYLQQHYQAGENRQTGYMRLSFILNCNGQIGRFNLQEMDEDFKPIQFDFSMPKQIIALVRKSDGWYFGKERKSENGSVKDVYIILMLKFEYGKLIDVYP